MNTEPEVITGGFVTEAERKAFREMMDATDTLNTQRDKFEAVVRPVMKYLAENHHPHTKIWIDSTVAELVEGCMVPSTEMYLVD